MTPHYIRLKNIELGFSLPGEVLAKVGIQRTRIYVNAYNLLTYSPDMKDFDPELAPSIDDTNSDGQSYPLQKIINMGVSITF